MYIVKEYLSNETVAVCSRKDDAVALILSDLERKLYIEVKQWN